MTVQYVLSSHMFINGLTARRGPQKTRRGPKVQRGPNFKFNFGPRSALDHAQPAHMQCTCDSNKIENAKLLMHELQISRCVGGHMRSICSYVAI